jgi:chromate reductase
MNILALCGSLRKQSRSLVLLQAMQLLKSYDVEFRIFDDLGRLALFNPDMETTPPCAVEELWQAFSWCDVLLIASPEYAHGVTGTIKNALDWLVSYPPFVKMPVAVFNPSHRAEHADAALKEILRTMGVHLISDASVRIPVTACALTAQELVRIEPYASQLTLAMQAIKEFMQAKQTCTSL